MIKHRTWQRTHWIDYLALGGFIVLIITIVMSVMGGSVIALIGGSLNKWGEGVGGGKGLPMAGFNLALLLTLPALISGLISVWRRPVNINQIFVFVGAFFLTVSFILIAHTIDPCYRGIWTLRSRYNRTIPLCQFFPPEVNIHNRFHLLLHAAPIVPLMIIYGYVVWRSYFGKLFSAVSGTSD